MNEKLIRTVTATVIEVLQEQGLLPHFVPVGVSARHLHLTREHADILFGKGYQLTPAKPLSQPGQFAAAETVDIVGPKGVLKGVRVLGPARSDTQVELSQSDARRIGIAPPVRSSGRLEGTPGAVLRTQTGELRLARGVIVADRHIHMTPPDAAVFGVKDGERVRVAVPGEKGGVMDQVTVRVDEGYKLDFHVDTDDANAFMLRQGQMVKVVRYCAMANTGG